MPEYISKDVAFQRLLCKESEFNHWNDYNLAQYIIAQIVPEDVVPATHIQKLGNIVQTIKNGRACRTFSCCGTIIVQSSGTNIWLINAPDAGLFTITLLLRAETGLQYRL